MQWHDEWCCGQVGSLQEREAAAGAAQTALQQQVEAEQRQQGLLQGQLEHCQVQFCFSCIVSLHAGVCQLPCGPAQLVRGSMWGKTLKPPCTWGPANA